MTKKNIISTATIMGTQLLKDCEYNLTSSDNEIEELLKVIAI